MPVTLNDVRFSYLNVFQAKPPFNNPQGEAKFSTTILVPKTNLQAKALMDQAIAAAIEEGVSAKWNGIRPPQPSICVHDGDGPRPSDGQPFGQECRGCWVFTASCKADRPPFVVDTQVQPIIDPTQVYSGMWGNVSVNFFAYNQAGKKGIGCGLNGIQKIRDDEPLSAHVTAQDAFQPVAAPAAAPGYGAAMPAAGYPGAYPQAPAAPAYQPPVAAPAYPQAPAVDPITGQPYGGYTPTGAPIMGM